MLRVPFDRVEAGIVPLSAEAARYVTRVHRLREGDPFVVFDPDRAIEADAVISEIRGRAVRARVETPRPSARPRRRITLVQATGKGDKLDAIVRDATELGASRVAPVLTERSVARPPATRAERWRRIAIEAARQCGRGDAPSIDPPAPLLDVLETLRGCPGLCLDPRATTHLGESLRPLANTEAVVIVVGPEGGLTEDELDAAVRSGLTRVTLGPLILRTETVCAAVLGALLALGDPLP